MPVLSVAGKLAILGLMIGPGVVNIAIYHVGALDVFNYLAYLKPTYHYQ